jgi:hypothetical protein
MKFGINDARDACYGASTALSYWVFRCRDRQKSPAMGTKTWTFLESAIQNSAEISTTIEDYLQSLSNQLIANLRPSELVWIVQPTEKIIRLNAIGEIQELNQDQDLNIYSWQEIIKAIAIEGFSEWDILELCRTKASIIQVLCRLRFETDRALGKEIIEEPFIEVTVNDN